MITYKEIKKGCFRLSKALNQPLAKVQETFAQALGHRDWNTFAGVITKNAAQEGQYVFIGFEEDSYLLHLRSDKDFVEIARATNNERLEVLVSHSCFEVDTSKLSDDISSDWNYTDCWKYIRQKGFSKFIERYQIKRGPRDHYTERCCPDCGETIPVDTQFGESCKNCGHVFTDPKVNDGPVDYNQLKPGDDPDFDRNADNDTRKFSSSNESPETELARLESAFAIAGGRGVEMAERIDELRGLLHRPKIIEFKKTLLIPKVWQDLLNTEDFDLLSEIPHKSYGAPKEARDGNGNIRNEWPHPLRDDHRVVSFKEDGYVVVLTLISGNNNYWTTARVIDPKRKEYESDEAGFDINDSDEISHGDNCFRWKQRLV